ncbi:MAG: hypothetical protein WDM96_17015 [Lacunisphaera sp.]
MNSRIPCSFLVLALAVFIPGRAQVGEIPLYKTIPPATPAELTPANGWPSNTDYRQWTRSSGGPTSNRFSALHQITPENVRRLEVAWTYHSADGEGNIQANPVAVGRRPVPADRRTPDRRPGRDDRKRTLELSSAQNRQWPAGYFGATRFNLLARG